MLEGENQQVSALYCTAHTDFKTWTTRFRWPKCSGPLLCVVDGGRLLVLQGSGLAERHVADNRKLKTFQSCYFGGMIRKQ